MSANWEDLRFLLACLKTGSFVQAARTMGVDATTVGRRITALERQVGVRLIQREPGRLRATEAGSRLESLAMEFDGRLGPLLSRLAGADHRVEGRIRITGGDGFGSLLVRVAAQLRALHRALEVELLIDPRVLDIARGEADLAVRTGRTRERSLSARRVGALGYGLYASADYLARNGAPASPDELGRHALVGYAEQLERLPEMRWLNGRGVRRFAFRSNSAISVLEAVEHGLGIAPMATALCAGRPMLRRVLAELELPSVPVWLVFRQSERKTARVRAIADALAAELLAASGPRRLRADRATQR